MPDASGGIFSGLYWVFRGKTPMDDLNDGQAAGSSWRDTRVNNPSQGGIDFNAPPYNAPPGETGRIAGPGEFPCPGGYLETDMFGGRHWHDYKGGEDLYGDAAQAKNDEFELGGGGQPSSGGGAFQQPSGGRWGQ